MSHSIHSEVVKAASYIICQCSYRCYMSSCEGCDVAATNLTCIFKCTAYSIDNNNVCFYCWPYK